MDAATRHDNAQTANKGVTGHAGGAGAMRRKRIR